MKRKALITSISGTRLKKNEIDLLKKYRPWGIILFKRNIHSFEQLKSLINTIKKITKDKNNIDLVVKLSPTKIKQIEKEIIV